MKKLFVFILLLLTILPNLSHARRVEHNKVITPFGLPNRQPPTGAGIKILDTRLGFKAQQTCGYTDWRTTSLILPKQLLSGQYWKHVGKQVIQQSKQVLMSLSGVIVPMLVTNISPTFANIMNKAEMLASAQVSLDADTCEILDGIANQSFLQGDELRRCVKEQLAKKRMTPGQAREVCLTRDTSSLEPFTPEEQIANTASKTKSKGFDMKKFIDELFPTKVKNSSGRYTYLTEGGFTYSRRSSTKKFMAKFFPGVTLRGGATYVNGGTFQPNVDDDIAKQAYKTRDAILQILREMKKHQSRGFSNIDIINKSKHLWESKNSWKSNKEPHPIYRATSDGSEPPFLITPEQIMVLLPLTENEKGISLENHDLRQVLDRLTISSSYVKTTDKLSDIYSKALNKCMKDPNYQDAVSQQNCKLILKNTLSQMDILRSKREAEENVTKIQREISAYVRSVQEEQLKRMHRPTTIKATTPPKGKIKLPGTY